MNRSLHRPRWKANSFDGKSIEEGKDVSTAMYKNKEKETDNRQDNKGRTTREPATLLHSDRSG